MCSTLQKQYFQNVFYLTETVLSKCVLPYRNSAFKMCSTLQKQYFQNVFYVTETVLSKCVLRYRNSTFKMCSALQKQCFQNVFYLTETVLSKCVLPYRNSAFKMCSTLQKRHCSSITRVSQFMFYRLASLSFVINARHRDVTLTAKLQLPWLRQEGDPLLARLHGLTSRNSAVISFTADTAHHTEPKCAYCFLVRNAGDRRWKGCDPYIMRLVHEVCVRYA
jgi:hypothetical protein